MIRRFRPLCALGAALAAALVGANAGAVDRPGEGADQGAKQGDRRGQLEGLREEIEAARERVSGHEASERAILEELETVDRRLGDVLRERDAARREVGDARAKLASVRPQLDVARRDLDRTRRALAARAVALYRGGELGAVRVLFAPGSFSERIARASALRRLVRHDATLVDRGIAERDRLAAVEAEAEALVARRETANARLSQLVGELDGERRAKASILSRVRRDRGAERRLLVELEQAAEALEATIRGLGGRASESAATAGEGGVGLVRGQLARPVDAPITATFGRVVDPEFQTQTFRSGVEFAAEAGRTVRSVARGVVRFAGWFRGYGRIVIVDHGDAYHTVSGHLDEIAVAVDDVVVAGQPIGTVGETGSLSGPSLYFELRHQGAAVDPAPWLGDR